MTQLRKQLHALKYPLLLLLAAAIWGLGTVLIKGIVAEIPPFWLVGGRFFSAGLVFCVLFAPQLARLAREGRLAEHMKVGFVLGIPMIAGYMANSLGLVDTTAAKSSFLTGLYCVLVPFIAWALTRKRPTAFNICAAVLCIAGVGLVSLIGQDDLAMGWGDAVTLLSALLLAVQLALTSKLAPGRNMLAVTALQFVFGGAMALGVATFTEQPPALQTFSDPSMLGSLAYLVLGATCAALLLQNVGLAKVPAASGSLLLSFEAVFGVLFSVLLLGEALTVPMLCGFALIFLALVVSEWLPSSQLSTLVRRRLRTSDQAESHSHSVVGTHAGPAARPPMHARCELPPRVD